MSIFYASHRRKVLISGKQSDRAWQLLDSNHVLLQMNSTTAGKGDPYWYEWTVGLQRVVDMLQPESGIQSVSFQVTGVKGWDDVVVRYEDGRSEFVQVKNSRVGKNITFGDLVGVEDQGGSLLGNLFAGWKAMKLNPEREKCILFTNRAAGESTGRSMAGVLRPPLLKFMDWLGGELNRTKSLNECKPPGEWEAAWKEWLAQLTPGTPEQQFSFLNSLEIRSNQEDLQAMEKDILETLGRTFQIPSTRALPLFQALDHALREWTTHEKKITVEDAYSAMALDDGDEPEHRAPPPPVPFFPSRQKALDEIENALKNPDGSPLVFLCAEPGAGKTSLISQLANRRVPEALQGVVGLRYFAFRPITPDSPLIPPDADHLVRADRLWFNLLSQLRRGLKGKLREYQVPLRNGLLTWPEARASVLRISSRLGSELGRPFVIAVDGIDHAARSMRYQGTEAKEFFASLPGPDEIGKSSVRVMLAGQPPDSYPEYPAWLRAPHPKIQTLGIGTLDATDVRVLVQATKSPIPAIHENAVVHAIEMASHGNTLAVVFAVEETRTCNSVDELQRRLADRHLGDGLREYYTAIWEHAFVHVTNPSMGLEIAVASTLCLTSERLTGQLMSSAFKQMGWTSSQWQMLLKYLGPLVVEEKDGFRVLHNDVRVFLHGYLASQPPGACRQAASMLADHYLNSSGRRWFAHKSLRRLLREAGREVEWATVFTVDWVFEAAALGIAYAEMSDDCVEALRQGTILKDWDVMLELACATETLECWEQKCESKPASARSDRRYLAPGFLHTELFVRPIAEWRVADLRDLIHDAELLLAAGEGARSRGLFERWLGGLSVLDLCHSTTGLVEFHPQSGAEEPRLSMGEHRTLESLGKVCRSVGLHLKDIEPKKPVEHDALASFEAGWVQSSCGFGPFDSLASCFANRPIQYLGSYEAALRNLASSGHWPLIRELMAQLRGSRDRLTNSFTAQAAWWALRSDAAVDEPKWLDVLGTAHFEFAENSTENLDAAVAICQALSWKDAAAEPRAIAVKVFAALRIDLQRQDDFLHLKLLFRAAATLGRVWSMIHRRGVEAAGQILPPNEMASLATALWTYRFDRIVGHRNRFDAGQFAVELVDVAFKLGDKHRRALLEAADPIFKQYPVDFRRESIWRLYEQSGDILRLQSWVNQWLADDGWLWKDDASSRESIADDLVPLARQLGENELADRAEERLGWLQITYRGHKEYTFNTPISWFRVLAEIEPASWRDVGLKLWVLSEACSALGGDDRCGWDLGEILGAAAWRCGPTDVWQLFTTEYVDCGSESWFHPTANRIINGLSQRLRSQPHLAWRDRLAGWCLAVGLSRWFNNESIKSLDHLREALLDTADDESERILISAAIEHLTPGEFRRRPRADTWEPAASSTSVVDEGLDIWLMRIVNGDEVHPTIAARLLREAHTERPTELRAIAEKILAAVGVGAAYGWGWESSGSLHDAILEIGRLVPDDLLWMLVSAAVKYAGDGSAWTQGVGRNLYSALLARAAKHGQPTLHAGISRILGMHERWARGGRNELELPVVKLGTAEPVASWTELAARGLAFLLASRSAEVIESALVGVHALATHDPNAVELFVQLANGNPWKQKWILNAAEVWAVLFPKKFEGSRLELQGWLSTGPLHQRLQTWIVLRQLAKKNGTPLPPFPNPSIIEGSGQTVLHRPRRDIMSTPATQHGSIRLVDLHHAAESTIKRVEHVTSADLAEIRSTVAEGLQQAAPEVFEAEPWPVRIRCSGDTRCSPLFGDLILDQAFDEFMRNSPLPQSLGGFFAQAYLGNENPWTLRATPIPDALLSIWPEEDELRGTSQKPTDIPAIRRKLLLLATRHAIADDEMALAARVQVFTYRDDFIFRLWWEEGSPDGKEVLSQQCPTTLSGRTFVFDFDDWWEPFYRPGKRPVTFAVGGQQRLGLCFPEFMPAKLWHSEFGWRPAMENPFVWLAGDQPIVRYEFIHGTPRFTQSGHPRQPVIGRWVVKKSAWEPVEKSHGPLRMRDDFQHFSSNVEH